MNTIVKMMFKKDASLPESLENVQRGPRISTMTEFLKRFWSNSTVFKVFILGAEYCWMLFSLLIRIFHAYHLCPTFFHIFEKPRSRGCITFLCHFEGKSCSIVNSILQVSIFWKAQSRGGETSFVTNNIFRKGANWYFNHKHSFFFCFLQHSIFKRTKIVEYTRSY